MSLGIPYDLARAEGGALLVCCAVSPTFVPTLENIAEAWQAKNPKGKAEQVLDVIFLAGLLSLNDKYKLPRVGSNPDIDA